MLLLSEALINRPILSLRTGSAIGMTTAPLINPNNLKVEAFFCQDKFDKKATKILLYQDVRDLIRDGFVVNDHDALTDPHEVVRLKKLINLNFELIGKPVLTESKERVGKVTDYVTETSSMFIQKLHVGQNLLKSFTGGTLTIDRTQIVEITNRRIIIMEILRPTKSAVPATAPINT